MIKIKLIPSRNGKPASKGQALVLLAVAFLVLLAFVGLTTDVGLLFIYMGHLRRAVDAASLAAAAQYRESRTIAELTSAASQVIDLNGVDPTFYTLTVQTCETDPGDTQLCTMPRRKLVRVTADLRVPTAFLHLVGVNTVNISADSIGEAASLDVVLVIDLSESMAWDASPGNPMRDPSQCNAADPGGSDGFVGECEPFQEVKRAAIRFTDRILNKAPELEEDRLQIVTFANGWSNNIDQGTHYRFIDTSVTPNEPRWTSDHGEVVNMIQSLNVYQPGACFDPPESWEFGSGSIATYYGPCRAYYSDGSYAGFDCIACQDHGFYGAFDWPSGHSEWSTFPTTNIGGGLLRAGNMFAVDTREDALWIVVMLTDGMANVTDQEEDDIVTSQATYPIGFCPDALGDPNTILPNCQDEDVTTRHSDGNANYDADDYARDMADFVGCMPINPAASCGGQTGQGAVIFAIGLGDIVLDDINEAHGRPYGATLLRYIAAVGDDGDATTDPCSGIGNYTTWCGNYYFAPTGNQLNRIFEDIASRIFTRLTH